MTKIKKTSDKKILFLSALVIFLLGIAIFVGNKESLKVAGKDTGFNQYGYNYNARLFNGTLSGWCKAKGISVASCPFYGFGSANDKLVMKWNAEWDRGNAEKWANGPYGAWTDNEWNGKTNGGSGYVWHYKIKWVGSCGADGVSLPDGGYCIWGQFEVLMDQGTGDGIHNWFAKSKPNGYGVKP